MEGFYPPGIHIGHGEIPSKADFMFMNPSVAIVGCSDLGMTIGKRVVRYGLELAGVCDSSLSVVIQAASALETDQFTIFPWEITWDADIIFLTCPEERIQETCNDIAARSGFRECSMVYHFSSRLSYTVLTGAKRCGAFIGAISMVQPSSAMETMVNKHLQVSIDGEAEAVSTGIFLSAILETRIMHEC